MMQMLDRYRTLKGCMSRIQMTRLRKWFLRCLSIKQDNPIPDDFLPGFSGFRIGSKDSCKLLALNIIRIVGCYAIERIFSYNDIQARLKAN
jgi:hypothetical protein